MENMLERVARALEAVYDQATTARKDTWETYARAAIEAMREATEEMGDGGVTPSQSPPDA